MSSDAAHPNPDVARRLAHLYTLHRTEIDLRPDMQAGKTSPYRALLAKLGNPHFKLPPVVHIAGTNGKGSTLAFLRAMAEDAGKRVHVYTSPHLVTFNERIRLAGSLITDEALIALYDRVEAANGDAPVTFFEFTTAMAFLAFAETPADLVLLETGMGGRLDCTNVVENPVATAITKISFDHTEFLGDTLPKIAAEKAGIMKPGIPCVIGNQMDPGLVLPVFEDTAKRTGAWLIPAVLPEGSPAPNLMGLHQLENAAVAATLGELLNLPPHNIRRGLTQAQWPARLQLVRSNPEIWFDAAHNDSGAQALAAQLGVWRGHGQVIHLIVGLAADKDTDAFFGALKGHYDRLTLVDLPAARKPQTAAQLKTRAELPDAATAATLSEAIENAGKNIKIVVAGSLYLYQGLF